MDGGESGRGDEIIVIKKFICLVCRGIIRNAIQLICCGTRLCEACCIDTAILCPNLQCRREIRVVGVSYKLVLFLKSVVIAKYNIFQYFKDRAFQKECESKSITCPRCAEWRGLIRTFQVGNKV